MRIILVGIIWIGMVGGLAFYVYGRGTATRYEPSAATADPAAGGVTLEITPTFTAEPDPFALQTSTTETPAAIVLRLNGQELARVSEKVEGGKPLRIEVKAGATTGSNELFVEASPPAGQFEQAHAVRVRIYRDGLLLADQTVWSETGGKASGSVFFKTRTQAREEHQH